MQIRLARCSDLAAAARLWSDRLSLIRQNDIGVEPLPNAEEKWCARAKSWLNDINAICLVAEIENELIGFLAILVTDNRPGMHPPRIGVITEMVVDLHQAHAGLSGRLLGGSKQWLRKMNITQLEVDVPARYPVEEAFWHGQGAALRANKYWLRL